MADKKVTTNTTKIATPVANSKVAETTKEETVKKEPEVKAVKPEVKDPVKKTAAKKTTAKKTAVKKTAAKKTTAVKKEETKNTKIPTAVKNAGVYIQFNNQEDELEALKSRIIEKWCAEEGKKPASIKEINIYIKPEDNAAYYVINGQGSSIQLFGL